MGPEGPHRLQPKAAVLRRSLKKAARRAAIFLVPFESHRQYGYFGTNIGGVTMENIFFNAAGLCCTLMSGLSHKGFILILFPS